MYRIHNRQNIALERRKLRHKGIGPKTELGLYSGHKFRFLKSQSNLVFLTLYQKDMKWEN